MPSAKLVKPDASYMEQFRKVADDFIQAQEGVDHYREAQEDFPGYLRKLQEREEGIDLPEGMVPWSTYWLIEKTSEIVGILRIRHERIPMGHLGYDVAPSYRRMGYGTLLLRLGLQEAKKRGISPVLVASNSDNLPSVKILENGGGRLVEESPGRFGQPVRRYEFDVE